VGHITEKCCINPKTKCRQLFLNESSVHIRTKVAITLRRYKVEPPLNVASPVVVP
jgi:hypothetical protein